MNEELDNSNGPKIVGMSEFIFRHKILWLFLIISLGVVGDQVSKTWVQKNHSQAYTVSPGKIKHYSSKTMVVIPKAFNLIYKENDAAAFSLTSSMPDWFRKPFLIIISAVATLFFIACYFRLRHPDALLMTSFSLILAGAVGNFIDRVMLGYVIDFIDIYAGFLGYPHSHWPTFNIADSCIVVGALGVVMRALLPRFEEIE